MTDSNAAPKSCDLKVTADWALTMGRQPRVIEDPCVAVTDGRIVWIGPQSRAGALEADRTIERPGCALMPGLVNAHTHLFQTLVRGMGDNLGLFGWIREVVWPFIEHMSTKDLYIASLAGAAEAVRSGTTFVLENHYALTDVDASITVQTAVAEVGLRGVVARGVVGPRPKSADDAGLPNTLFRYTSAEELELMEECLRRNQSHSLVQFWPSPLMLTFMQSDLTADAIRLARKYGVPWHTHCAESKDDGRLFREVNGLEPIEWLAKRGLLGRDATLAHGIWLTEREIDLLGRAGSTVIHNPVSNGFCGMGVMPLASLRGKNVNIALGSDGPGSNNTVDMFEVMKATTVLQKAANCNPDIVTAEDALTFATSGGARCVGMEDEIGELHPGRRADLIAVDLSALHTTPVHRLASSLVYSARGTDVKLTLIDGKVVFDGRNVVGIDETELREELSQRALSIAKRAIRGNVAEHWMETTTPPTTLV